MGEAEFIWNINGWAPHINHSLGTVVGITLDIRDRMLQKPNEPYIILYTQISDFDAYTYIHSLNEPYMYKFQISMHIHTYLPNKPYMYVRVLDFDIYTYMFAQ